jgi:competence protein CoiA
MMLALVDGQRSHARPGLTGLCGLCDGPVIPKCGQINVWHWAHRSAECDRWAEPMTQWHVDWQDHFPLDACEVTIGDHRADVLSPTGIVIEFQHSALSADEIRERESHYGQMLWVFDAIGAYNDDRLNLRKRPAIQPRGAPIRRVESPYGPDDNYRSFRWKYPRRSILACRRPVFLDLGDGNLLELKKMHPNAPYGGWGLLVSKDTFLERCGLVFTLGGIQWPLRMEIA